MRIAIIGTGIAGLSAAWLLSRDGHQVSVFERLCEAGFSSQSRRFDIDGQQVTADVPSRMFNQLLWPNVVKLYRAAGIEFSNVDTSQSFSSIGSSRRVKLHLPYLPPTGSIADFRNLKLFRDLLRFKKTGEQSLTQDDHELSQLSFGQYLERHRVSEDLIKFFLYPILSTTVCTCDYTALDNYPANIILESLHRINGDQPLLRVHGGTHTISDTLLAGIDDLRFNTDIETVVRQPNQVMVGFVRDNKSHTESFDQVIIATQANHARTIVGDLTSEEDSMLSAFDYQEVEVLVHRDSKLLNADQAPATFNFVGAPDGSRSMCTVHLNRFHNEWPELDDVYQTILPFQEPEPRSLLYRARFQRPVVDENTRASWNSIDRLHQQADRRLWFCGSYAYPGIPLLESAVASVFELSKRLAERSPLSPLG